jgi:hypothetical protein
MRSTLIIILLGGIVSLGVPSCATVPKEPLASGEIRLLSIDVPGAGIKAKTSFAVNIFFEAIANQQIKKACFYESGEEPYCLNVTYGTFGTKKVFQAQLPGMDSGSHRVECYAEYIRDGETRKTNVIAAQIFVGR